MDDELTMLVGCVTHWHVETNDFRAGTFRVKGMHQDVNIAGGGLTELPLHIPVELYGKWGEYQRKGGGAAITQFKASTYIVCEPTSLKELELLLAATIPFMGPKRATQLIKHFGDQTEMILTERPDRLVEVKGISTTIAGHIAEGWKAHRLERSVSKLLVKIGMPVTWAPRILDELGPNAAHMIEKDPYCLVRVRGIDFTTADKFAKGLGWDGDSPKRAEAILQYILFKASHGEGHIYLPEKILMTRAAELQPKPEILAEALAKLCAHTPPLLVRSHLVAPGGPVDVVYLPFLFRAERNLARRVQELMAAPFDPPIKGVDLDFMIQQSEGALGLELTSEQRQAVMAAFSKPVSILTGGPGTGKTCVVRVIVDICKRLQINLSMCAPTGRAAKHLSNVTGGEAFTIHRLFGYKADENSWLHNQGNPLSTRMTVVDECSMVDLLLGVTVFDGVPPGRPLMLLGDKDQLPSVGPGKVFEDLIECGKIPTTRLTQIFRQAAKSLIIQNAHRVLQGKVMSFPADKSVDCFKMKLRTVEVIDETTHCKKNQEDYQHLRDLLVKICLHNIPDRLHIDPIKDIQVLTPMKKDACGVHDLNRILQDALNPQPSEGEPKEKILEVCLGDKRFRLGDRVIQMKNNYKFNVYNGDIGFLKAIDEYEKTLDVEFYGEIVKLPFDVAREQMQLAYCMSIHKSQGSEFKAVVVVLLGRHNIMLQRNLLFTAMTRPQELLIFMSLDWVLLRATNNVVIQQRNSLLMPRIKKLMTPTTVQAA